jgi:hypothetical protein
MGAKTMCQRIYLLKILALVGLAACIAPRDAGAVLVNRYSFTGNANDSIGGANGTVVDVGSPTAVFAGGQLDLSANTGQGSNGITEDAYVDLPNGLITGLATGGTSGAFSVELWATVSETHTWQRYVDFGTSNAGEDTSGGGGNAPYIYIAANSGRWTNGLATEAHEPNGPLREVGQTGPLPNNVQLHIVGTYDQNDTSAGTNGTFKLYRNGALIGAAAIPPNLNLNTYTNNNNWIGRSQWPDPVFDGLFNELRLYNHPLTSTEVATDAFFGPDVLNPGELLSLTVNKNTGLVTMKNNATTAINVDFYRISSAASALSLANWNSLDTQNYDAVDGADAGSVAGDSAGEGWDKSGGSNASQLAELFLPASGSSIAPSEVLSLGNAFNTSVFGSGNNGDLQFTFGLVGGLQLTGNVTYVGGGVLGDYNNNGIVDAGDYVLWRKGGPLQNEGDTPGVVNAADYTYWRSRFGATSGTGAGVGAAAVPEPTSWLTMLLAATALSACWRTRD